MNYEVKEQLYEGKAKQVFSTNDPEIVMVHYRTMPPPVTARRRAPSATRASSTTSCPTL